MVPKNDLTPIARSMNKLNSRKYPTPNLVEVGQPTHTIYLYNMSFMFTIIHTYIHTYMDAFQKGIVRKKKTNKWTFECRSHAFSFSFSSGPPTKCSSTARQRKVCARFAQGFDSSARQAPVTGEQMILTNQGQNRAQPSRKLAQANAQARPSRATTCPCAATCPF